jgi:hypothetical protein
VKQLTAEQQQSLREADTRDMALVTMIDERVAIILPLRHTDEAIADYILLVSAALERAGLC